MNSVVRSGLGLFLLLASLAVALFLRNLPPAGPLIWLIPVCLSLAGLLFCLSFRWRHWMVGGLIAVVMILGWVLAGNKPVRMTTSPGGPGHGGLQTVQLQVPDRFRRANLAEPRYLQIVPGLGISVFAAGLDRPRMLAFDARGNLFVSLPHAGRVVALPDTDHDGVADEIRVFASDLDRPHGLAFDAGILLVAENGRLVRLPDADHDLKADRVEVVSNDLPAGGGHWTRSVVVDAGGDYFVSAGSSCNVCEESDPRRAAILRIEHAGGRSQVYARGLRNSVGLAIHPRSGELWASNNGRDMLGDDLPPEEINLIVKGGDYGWPYCYGRRIPDPDFGSEKRCRQTLQPMVEMQAHSAPLGIVFGAGLDFPLPFRQMLFVAFHGSWNRSTPTGYKLVGIPFADSRPVGPVTDIVSGWLQSFSAWGRPVAPVVGPDGALYLSDDRAGVIYRITAAKGRVSN